MCFHMFRQSSIWLMEKNINNVETAQSVNKLKKNTENAKTVCEHKADITLI